MYQLVTIGMAETDEVVGALAGHDIRVMSSTATLMESEPARGVSFTVKVPDAETPENAVERVRAILEPLGWGNVRLEASPVVEPD